MDNESKNSHLPSLCSSNQIYPALPKWLSENVEGVNQCVKRMLEIIEEAENPSAKRTEMYHQKRPELIALIEDINQKHQFLAERYDLLSEDLHGNIPAGLQMQNPESTVWHSCKQSSLLTPDQKLGMHKIERRAISFDVPLSSGGSSSNVSVKEGFESSFILSSGSDTESYHSSPHQHPNLVKKRFVDTETGLSGEFANSILKVEEISEYDVLLSRITEYEEKLRISNQKLGFSEDEISRLKSQLKCNTSVNIENLKTELERAKDEVKMREDDLEVEKKKVLELEMRVAALENVVFDSSCEIATLVKELEITREKLGTSEEELSKLNHDISQSTLQLHSQLESTQNDMASLKANLASEKMQVLELLERITRYKAVISDRDYEIRKLTAALQDSLRNSETEKSTLQFHNSSLSEKLTILEARCAEHEVQIMSLKNEIQTSEASTIQMEGLYEAREMRLRTDIEGLKAELNEKCKLVESLNKNLDGLKLKYDMLMAQKDGLNAKVQTLGAELCSRDNKIQQLDGQLHQLQLQQIEQIAVSESAFKLRDELRLKVEELEKEVEKQAVTISDRAEEKREAIRQLCFSLEHYRTGYQELREAYVGQRRHAVIAS